MLAHLYLLDIQGRVVESFNTNGDAQIKINKGNYIGGMYLLIGLIDGQVISEKVMITN